MRNLLVPLLVLLAGCVAPWEELDEPAPTSETKTATDPDYPGLRVQATLITQGTRHRLDAVAQNLGPRTYHVSSICLPPWFDAVKDERGVAVWPEPRVYCAAFGTKPFGPGSSEGVSAFWNETKYDEPGERTVPAPAGRYTWTATFHAATRADEGPEAAVAVAFPVTVG